MKHSAISDGSATVFSAEGEVTATAAFEHVYAVPDGATHAVVMMEAATGDAGLDVRLEPLAIDARDELSRLARVKLRFLALAEGTEELALRITSAGKAAVVSPSPSSSGKPAPCERISRARPASSCANSR